MNGQILFSNGGDVGLFNPYNGLAISGDQLTAHEWYDIEYWIAIALRLKSGFLKCRPNDVKVEKKKKDMS